MLSRGWVFLQALKYGREVVCFFLCLLMQLAAGTIWPAANCVVFINSLVVEYAIICLL